MNASFVNWITSQLLICVTLTTLSLAAVAEANTPDVQKHYTFDLPQQSVADSLNDLAKHTGAQFLFPFQLAQSKTAKPITGHFTLLEATAQLLQNTGLKSDLVDGVLTISPADDAGTSGNQNHKGKRMNITTKKSLLATMVGLFAATGGLQQAYGQDGEAATAQGRIDEIIVTAERRAENIHNIPVAISAFSGDRLGDAGVTGIGDLKQLAPSLQFGQSSIDTFVSIRGIGAELTNINAETGVTISQDGVPYASQFMFDTDFLDVERVEVLRGPQGTINGRNATGGAINIHSHRPSEEFEGGIKATLGNYDRYGIESYLSGPILNDDLFGRFVVRVNQADGWLQNTFRNEDQNGVDKAQARVSFVANMTKNLEAYLVLEGVIDEASKVSDVDLGRARPDEPGFAEALGVPGFDSDRLEYQADFANIRRIESHKGILKLTWDMGPTASLTSTTGYLSYKREAKDDIDATIVAGTHFDRLDVEIWQASEELTLIADLSDQLDVILGAFYLNSNAESPYLFGLPLLGLPEGSFFIGPEQDLTSYAVYTQWRYRLTDDLRVSIGARYTEDKKTMSREQSIFGRSSPFISMDGSWNAVTPRIAIDYTPKEDLTIYTSVSRGFKAGGFTSLTDPVEYNPEFVWNYEVGIKATWLDQRLRTTLAGFYMDYTDLQQGLLISPPGGGVPSFEVRNANSATIEGVELELDAVITDRFSISASGTWLDATYDELLSGDQIFPELGERDLAGNRLVRAPKFQFNLSGKYTVILGNGWRSVLRADYQWQDQIFFTFFNHELNSQKAYGLLNFSATAETEDGSWQLSAFSRNALDERYISSSSSTPALSPVGEKSRKGQIGSPRIYGLSFTYNF